MTVDIQASTGDPPDTRSGAATAAVEVTGARKRFGVVAALDGADLSVPRGSVVALLGPSGCGKTTLLRTVAGFERLDDGEIKVDGRVMSRAGIHVPPERRGVGIVPQEQALFPHLSVAGNIGFGLSRSRRSSRNSGRRERIEAMLAIAGLEGMGARMPHELSGGQQQRVALARALAPSPAVVLLDEPFANLDATLRVSLRAEVRRILRRSRATTVLVTHDQEEALSTADLVAVMRAGRVVQVGTPDDVYRRPVDVWVAGFVGDANVLRGELVGEGRVRCALGVLPAQATGSGPAPGSGSVNVMVRPEQLVLTGSAGGSAPGEAAVVAATVVDVQYFGHDALVTLRLTDGTAVVARDQARQLVAPGSEVAVRCQGEVVCFAAS